jgi:hypothetical protein
MPALTSWSFCSEAQVREEVMAVKSRASTPPPRRQCVRSSYHEGKGSVTSERRLSRLGEGGYGGLVADTLNDSGGPNLIPT